MADKMPKDTSVLQANIKIEWVEGGILNHSAGWRIVETDAAKKLEDGCDGVLRGRGSS